MHPVLSAHSQVEEAGAEAEERVMHPVPSAHSQMEEAEAEARVVHPVLSAHSQAVEAEAAEWVEQTASSQVMSSCQVIVEEAEARAEVVMVEADEAVNVEVAVESAKEWDSKEERKDERKGLSSIKASTILWDDHSIKMVISAREWEYATSIAKYWENSEEARGQLEMLEHAIVHAILCDKLPGRLSKCSKCSHLDWVHSASPMDWACIKCDHTGLHGPLFMDPCEATNEDVSDCRERMESSLAKRLHASRECKTERETTTPTEAKWAEMSLEPEITVRETDIEMVVVEPEGQTLSPSAVTRQTEMSSGVRAGELRELSVAASEWLPLERAQATQSVLSAAAASWQPVSQPTEVKSKMLGHAPTPSPIWLLAKNVKKRRRRKNASCGKQKAEVGAEPMGAVSVEHTVKVAATVRRAVFDAVFHYPRIVGGCRRKDIVVMESSVRALMDEVERGMLGTKRDLAHAAECLVEAASTQSEGTAKSAAEKWVRYSNSRLPFAQDRDEVAEHLNANGSCLSLHPGLYKKRDKCAQLIGRVKRSKQCKKKKVVPMKKLAVEARPRPSRKAYCIDMARKAKLKRASERVSHVQPWSSCYRLDRKSLAKLDMCLCTSLDYLDPMSRFLIEGNGARRVREIKLVGSPQHNFLPPLPDPASATLLPHNQSGRF